MYFNGMAFLVKERCEREGERERVVLKLFVKWRVS